MASSVFAGLSIIRAPSKLATNLKSRGTHAQFRARHTLIPRAAITADRASLDITKMQPLGDRVLVKPFEAEDTSEGGVLLPSSATDTGNDALFGEVLSVGEDVTMALKKGDKVIFNTQSSAKVEVVDGEIVFLYDKNILATIE